MFVKSGNDRIWLSEKGDNANHEKVVLLLHSLGTDHRLWDYQVSELTSRGYYVLAPDSRGHGRSSSQDGIEVSLWIRDIKSILDSLALGKVIICGISMGGVQAITFANEHPERVEALVLADTFGAIDSNAIETKISSTAGLAAEKGMKAYAQTYLETTLLSVNSTDRVWNNLEEAISGMNVEDYRKSAIACFANAEDPSFDGEKIETLIVIGDEDRKTPIYYSELLKSNIVKSQLKVVNNAGHLSNVDNSVEYTNILLDFLSSMKKGRS